MKIHDSLVQLSPILHFSSNIQLYSGIFNMVTFLIYLHKIIKKFPALINIFQPSATIIKLEEYFANLEDNPIKN